MTPLSVCQKHDLGDMKSINIHLQLAYRSIKYPIGMLEDGNEVPTDFVIMKMK